MNYAIISSLALTCMLTLSAFSPAFSADDPKDKDPATCGMNDAEMKAMERMSAIGENHKLLEYMNGNWSTKTIHIDEKSQKPVAEADGKCVSTPIMGGRFIKSDHTSTMMGKPMEGTAISGYDNIGGNFVTTWIDNFSTHIMYSNGKYDAANKTFTYISTMDDPMNPGKKFDMKEVIKLVDKDKHVMTFFSVKDGKESKFMEITYTRAGA